MFSRLFALLFESRCHVGDGGVESHFVDRLIASRREKRTATSIVCPHSEACDLKRKANRRCQILPGGLVDVPTLLSGGAFAVAPSKSRAMVSHGPWLLCRVS